MRTIRTAALAAAAALFATAAFSIPIKTGESHCHLVTLKAGEHATVSVVQKGIDVVVRADGMEVDVHTGSVPDPELLYLVADEPRVFEVEVAPLRGHGTRVLTGEYQISIEKSEATEFDRVRVAAQRALSDGNALAGDGSVDSLRASVPHVEEALELSRSIDDKRAMGITYIMLATTLQSLRENSAALKAREEALPLLAELGWSRNVGLTHMSIGWLYDNLGDYQRALDHLQKADEILRKEPGLSGGHATVLASLGLAYAAVGDQQKALDYFEKTLVIYRNEKNRRGEAIVLHDVGQVHASAGDHDRALTYFDQALKLHRETKNVRREAQTLTSIARVHAVRGDREKALPMFEDALRSTRATGDRRLEAVILDEIGEVRLGEANVDAALETYREALAIQREIGDRPKQAASLYGIARAQRRLGNLDDARAAIEECLALVESMRAGVEPRDLRLSFRAATSDYYEAHIETLMALHEREPKAQWAARAFEASERARARALVEALQEVRSDLRSGVDRTLLARERNTRARLNDKEQARIHLLTSGARRTAVDAVDREIRQLLGELNEIEADIRRNSPRYATLVAPEALTVAEIQQNVLDADTALIEIALGTQRSFAWTVTREGVTVRTLPAREHLTSLARRAHTLVTARNGEDRTRIAAADAEFANVAAKLRDVLLPKLDPRYTRVLVVPEGPLHFVPFAALTRRELVVLPSATALAMMRRNEKRARAEGVIAVVADPVFRSDDARMRAPVQVASASLDLPRLRFSRREAEIVDALVPAGQKIIALDFDARRDVLSRVGNYRIVHFATHAVIDDVHPELSSLVLSTVDRKGAVSNGRVRLHEIYDLDLRGDLVVLSACQTALGKEMRGEGLVSLTHGFMYAGAPRVVATLWRIDDRATAELMKHFYTAVLRDRLSPAAALRRAQHTLAADKRWSAPYYWAGFVIQGEPR